MGDHALSKLAYELIHESRGATVCDTRAASKRVMETLEGTRVFTDDATAHVSP